jgi:hypothetical protein
LLHEGPASSQGAHFGSSFAYKIAVFSSGAEGIRTPDLRRAKADRLILACPTASGNFRILQVFCGCIGGLSSAAYQCVSLRLQYARAPGGSGGSCVPSPSKDDEGTKRPEPPLEAPAAVKPRIPVQARRTSHNSTTCRRDRRGRPRPVPEPPLLLGSCGREYAGQLESMLGRTCQLSANGSLHGIPKKSCRARVATQCPVP